MANILVYDKTTSYAINYLRSADTSKFIARDDVLINPIMPERVPISDLRVDKGVVVQKTAEQLEEAAAIKHASEYKLKRESEYPKTGDIIDALFKHLAATGEVLSPELEELANRRQQVKAKYPKPGDV